MSAGRYARAFGSSTRCAPISAKASEGYVPIACSLSLGGVAQHLEDQAVFSRENRDPGSRQESRYGVQLTAGPFVFSFPGELQFTM